MISLCARRGEKEGTRRPCDGEGEVSLRRLISPPLAGARLTRWLGSNLSPCRQPKNARINCSVSALADARDTATFTGRG
jgi:hypothetical protein